MIHNLQVKGSLLTFRIITEIGQVWCTVHLTDLDKDNRSKCYADKYDVLGVRYIHNVHFNTEPMVEGIKRIGNAVREICDNNGWCLWSY